MYPGTSSLLRQFSPRISPRVTHQELRKISSKERPSDFTEKTPFKTTFEVKIKHYKDRRQKPIVNKKEYCLLSRNINRQCKTNTVEPPLRGHPRDQEKCPLNGGVP